MDQISEKLTGIICGRRPTSCADQLARAVRDAYEAEKKIVLMDFETTNRGVNMNKKLVAYFSASGVTADAAKKIAEATGADIYEIRPEVPYTQADLNWQDQNSRSSKEMKDKSSRPSIADKNVNIAEYDVIYLGFPIWWYTAPTIVNTFLESYNFEGKKIVLFATSGSSGFENTLSDLKKSVSHSTVLKEGIVVHGQQDVGVWKKWVDSLGI